MPLRPAGATGGPFLCRHVTSLAPGSRLLEMRWGPSPLWSVRLRPLCSGHRQRQPRPSRRALPSATAMSAALMKPCSRAWPLCSVGCGGAAARVARRLRKLTAVARSGALAPILGRQPIDKGHAARTTDTAGRRHAMPWSPTF